MSDDVIIELDLGAPASRKPSPRTRGAPQAGFEPDCFPLCFFFLCSCGSETVSQKPIPECPSCGRKA